jgi:hypothetical protein
LRIPADLQPEMPVVFLAALAIFAALTIATWWVSIACYRSTLAGPDPAADRNYPAARACAVALVTLTCLVPMPVGYFAGVAAWASAVYGLLDLPGWRAAVLVAYLAAWSAVTRLVILGVLSATAK